MKLGKTTSNIQNRKKPNDCFSTPYPLAKKLISYVPIKKSDIICDAFAGEIGNQPFFEQYPETRKGYVQQHLWTEIKEGKNAFYCTDQYDWIITNPPFSKITEVLEYSTWSCRKGFAYIMPNLSLTNKRIKMCEEAGFIITKIISFENPKIWNLGFAHMFVIFEKRFMQTKPGTYRKLKKLFFTISEPKHLQIKLEDVKNES
jgi:hypothetical protein